MNITHKILLLLTRNMPAKAIDLDGRYYIERYHVLTMGKLTILLHRYLGADGDRHQHDHPHRCSLGIPLIGGYDEERLIGLDPEKPHTVLRKIRPWRWNFIGTLAFHRIASVQPGTWTLFITWNRFKFWGELRPNIVTNRAELCGVKIEGFTYQPVRGTSPTNSNWYRSAESGKQLRQRRGTDY